MNRSYLLLLFYWIGSTLCRGQSPEVVAIGHLPETGVLLNKGWSWHLGDDPAFARPDFDDSKDIIGLLDFPK